MTFPRIRPKPYTAAFRISFVSCSFTVSCSSVSLHGRRLAGVHSGLLRRRTDSRKAVPIQLQNEASQIMAPRGEPLERKKIVSGGVEAAFRGDRRLEPALLDILFGLAAEVRIPSERIGEVPDLGF